MRRVLVLLAVLALVAAAWLWHTRRDASRDAAAAERLAVAKAVPRAFYGRRLEPGSNVILHGAGQSDEGSFNNYTAALSPARPMLTMKYVDLRDDLAAFFARTKTELEAHHEFLVPQIGLSLNKGNAATHYEAETARGVDDTRLAALCAGIRSLDRPVFLRVGYEFNGAWNGYEAAAYRASFMHIAAAMHSCSPQIAMVWNWSPRAELDTQSGRDDAATARARWQQYYPGDASVDWWSLDLFEPEEIAAAVTRAFLDDADRAHFPVMVGESTPRAASVRGGQASVDAWFAPYFGLLRSSRGIKAFCYIDWDWAQYPQWAEWGDGRLEDNDVVLSFYRSQVVGQSLYANASDRAQTLSLLRVR
ncbi:hypothetical protein ACFQBQ_06205 [Granulicella cerasi]|uniref:GH26 domain-containing protein n=1 Tax=Granulicella cerasi TaxID=741063 RepID=A0ABW1Z7L6_9BACT|nr:hypothetical protein [Granulicella cerasi]